MSAVQPDIAAERATATVSFPCDMCDWPVDVELSGKPKDGKDHSAIQDANVVCGNCGALHTVELRWS